MTANYFQLFGLPLAFGRPFTTEEERLGARIRVAIVSYSLWERVGADPNMLGRSLRLNGETFTIVGVAAKAFAGASLPGPEVWIPLGARRSPVRSTRCARVGSRGAAAGGHADRRCRPNDRHRCQSTRTGIPGNQRGIHIGDGRPSRLAFMPGRGSRAMAATLGVLLMVMPAIVLLVTCLNLANLLLARGHMRRREVAIMSSLGEAGAASSGSCSAKECSSRWRAARSDCCCQRGRPACCCRRCVRCSPSR